MREENGTFQDMRSAGERADEGGFVAVGERVASMGDVEPSAPGPELAFVPRTSGQILDTAMDLVRDRFGLYVLATSAVWFFVRLARPVLGLDQIDPFASDPGDVVDTAFMLLDTIAHVFALQLSTVVVALLAWPRIVGAPVRTGAVVVRTLVTFVPLLFLQFVVGSVVALGALLTCGLGLFYFPWKTVLVPLCYVLERPGFGGAIGRSWRLTSHEGMSNEAFFGFLRFVAVYGTGYLVYTGVSGLVEASDLPGVKSTVLDQTGIPGGLYDALHVALTTLVVGIGSALFSIVVLAYYLDCRIRRDGLGLERRLAAMKDRWKDPARSSVEPSA